MFKNQHGFGWVGIIAIIAFVGVAGLVGWRVWEASQKQNQPTATTSPQQTQEEAPTAKENTLTLASQKVTFALPESWTYATGGDKCRRNVAMGDITCLEGAVITPGAELPTRYGNGTEFFHIYASVYQNASRTGAQQWLENTMQEGTGTGDVTTSADKINGYDTFYRLEQYDGDGTIIREMWYVFVADAKAIVLNARTYEPGKLDDGRAVGDFRQFEDAIRTVAKSIVVR